MTTVDQIASLDNNTPCLCADGKTGILIRWPTIYDKFPEVGIQVPGEEGILWIPLTRIVVTDENTLVEAKP